MSRESGLKLKLLSKAQPTDPPAGPDWSKQLLWKVTPSGYRLEKNIANAITILNWHRDWRHTVAFDVNAGRVVITKSSPAEDIGPFPVAWGDVYDIAAATWLQRSEWRLDLPLTTVASAVLAIANDNTIDPLRSRLESLAWDGVARLDTWLPVYFGVDDSAYVRDVGAKWMISAIARVMQPGCKADHMLILEGKQGRKKSTGLRTLSLGYFTDELADLGSKDAAMQLHGVWIVEIAELDAMNRSDVSRAKAFITKTMDRYRAPYGRHVAEHPRRCVFAGSVNHNDYLRDESGGRRFWPVKCGDIDIDALQRDVEQLWAEAVVRYKAHEAWWFVDAAAADRAAEEQGDRYQEDAWDEIIASYVARQPWTKVDDILGNVINLERGRWGQTERNRVARCLKNLGWERKRHREGGVLEWRYLPAESVPSKEQSGNRLGTPQTPTFVGSSSSVPSVPSVPSSSEKTPKSCREDFGPTQITGISGNTGNTIREEREKSPSKVEAVAKTPADDGLAEFKAIMARAGEALAQTATKKEKSATTKQTAADRTINMFDDGGDEYGGAFAEFLK
jgi:predicted P-loop ATPase